MDELMKEYLEKSLETLEKGAVWLQGEIPLVIQEVLLFNGAKAGVWMLFSLVMMVGVVIVCKSLWRKNVKEGDKDGFTIILFLGSIFGTLSVIMFLVTLFTLLKITLAPRLYILEYAASLIK